MRQIRLTATEQGQLEQMFKTTTDRRLRDRCQAVLMASRGRKRKTIAQDLGVHRTTVRLWLKQYQEHGLEGLPIHWAPATQGGFPRRWDLQSKAGCKMGRRAVASIERTGPMKSWQHTCIGLPELRSSAPRCGSSVSARIYDPIGQRIAICEATRRSSRSRRKNSQH